MEPGMQSAPPLPSISSACCVLWSTVHDRPGGRPVEPGMQSAPPLPSISSACCVLWSTVHDRPGGRPVEPGMQSAPPSPPFCLPVACQGPPYMTGLALRRSRADGTPEQHWAYALRCRCRRQATRHRSRARATARASCRTTCWLPAGRSCCPTARCACSATCM